MIHLVNVYKAAVQMVQARYKGVKVAEISEVVLILQLLKLGGGPF